MASETANIQRVFVDNCSTGGTVVPILLDESTISESLDLQHTDVVHTTKDVSAQIVTKANTGANTTVKRIQTKNSKGRSFIELQDVMRHILKVTSRQV